jgi:tetratricopeptide (TPR) repeat protein
MSIKPLPQHLLNATMFAVLLLCAGAEVHAQGSAQERAEARRAKHANEKASAQQAAAAPVEAKYPDATREEPGGKASAKLTPKLQKLFEAYDEGDIAAAQTIGDEVLANPDANAYEKGIAARIVGSMYLGQDDAKAEAYLRQSIQSNGLGNNEHYESMLIIAQLQMQEEKYEESLATLVRFLSETKSTTPEHMVLKGNALYRLERYPEAIAVLKPAIEATPQPRADWTQLLMGAYAASGQPAEAARLAEKIAAGTPSDKRAQINLAATYLQSDQYDKAAEIYEKLRAAGQLTEERDYRNLYALYFNAQDKEQQVIEVINDGLAKGILKPDYASYQALAQAYYFADQPGKAIEAYQKAAPLAPDGQTYLDLAKILANEGRTAESKQAAQQALDKGVKDPAAARKLLAR